MTREATDPWERQLETETRSRPAEGRPAAAALVPGLTVLCHPDPRRVGERAALVELTSGREALLSRREPLFSAPGASLRRPLADPFLSRRPICLAPTSSGEVRLDVRDSGTEVAADGERVEGERRISPGDLHRGLVLLLADRVVLLLHRLLAAPPKELPRHELLGESPALLQLCREIQRVADLDVAVLLRGETGTGKELVARALHQAGPRNSGPYLAVNLGAVPASLAAAELFGAARGAFTGAAGKRTGYFERAQGGTLFLDEIGEVPLEVQALLLRVLESGEVQTVGAETPRRVDVRVVAATDADLETAVASERFRAPLLHRLRGYEIRLPALRERRDDVGRLFFHFVDQELAAVGERLSDSGPEGRPWLPAELIAGLAAADWPGNVRQLKNAARQLVIASRGQPQADLATAERLLAEARESGASPGPAPARSRESDSVYRKPEEVTEAELVKTLRAHRFRLQPAAAELGVSRASLYALIERFPGVRKPADLGREEIERARRRCGGDIEAMVDELQVSRKGLRRRMTQLGMP